MTVFLALLAVLQAEDPLPPRAVARLGSLQYRLTDQAVRVAFSPDGKTLILGASHDAGAWNLGDGKQVARARTLFNCWQVGVAFGNVPFALVDNSGEVRLINLSTGKEIQTIKSSRGWHGAALFGNLLAVAGMKGSPINLYDALEGTKTRELGGHSETLSDLAFSPDGKRLATASFDNIVKLWDVDTGDEKVLFQGSGRRHVLLTFSPDGKTLAFSGDDERIHFWDAVALKEQGDSLAAEGMASALAFSPDGKLLAAIVPNRVRVWDVAARKEICRMSRVTSNGSLAFSPDGKALAATVGAGVHFWDPVSGKELLSGPGNRNGVWSVSWSPDGASLATAGDNLIVWDVARRAERFRNDRRTERAAFSPDGTSIAVGGYRAVRLLDARSGVEVRKIDAHSAQITTLAWAPDGKTLLSGSPDKTVKLWDPATGKELRKFESPWPSFSAFSPDGALLAAADLDGSTRLWNVSDGKELWQLRNPRGQIWSVVFSPDGRTIAWGMTPAQIVETATGALLRKLPGPKASIMALSWSPDGKFIAGAPLDNRIRLWEASTGRQLHFLDGHQTQINALAFSPDGKFIASGSQDTTVLLWDVTFLKE
jgi:WD40 repeat protein